MQNELFWQFLAAHSTRTLRLSLKKKNTPPLELPSRSEGGFPFREGPSYHCCLCFMCSAFLERFPTHYETSEFLLTAICAQTQDESESESADIK